MDGKENVLEAILEGESLEDVDMLDAETIEEGEFYEHNQCIESTEGGEKDENIANQESHSKNRRRRTKKKKNKKKSGPISNVTDINRFVIDTCRRLKERKSYLVWNAVGCLGVSALSDLVKEVRFFNVPLLKIWLKKELNDENMVSSSSSSKPYSDMMGLAG